MLAYITYFIVTVIIGFVKRAANLAAAGTIVVGIECRLLACHTRGILNFKHRMCSIITMTCKAGEKIETDPE